jgi:hypothetical protein
VWGSRTPIALVTCGFGRADPPVRSARIALLERPRARPVQGTGRISLLLPPLPDRFREVASFRRWYKKLLARNGRFHPSRMLSMNDVLSPPAVLSPWKVSVWVPVDVLNDRLMSW